MSSTLATETPFTSRSLQISAYTSATVTAYTSLGLVMVGGPLERPAADPADSSCQLPPRHPRNPFDEYGSQFPVGRLGHAGPVGEYGSQLVGAACAVDPRTAGSNALKLIAARHPCLKMFRNIPPLCTGLSSRLAPVLVPVPRYLATAKITRKETRDVPGRSAIKDIASYSRRIRESSLGTTPLSRIRLPFASVYNSGSSAT
ncbi:Uncharacterised protein [Mycolicibacterium aichiense]|nr:Uncharacterised protein [Mycolicibacterium aichiense]